MEMTEKVVRYAAALAKLTIEEEELSDYQNDLQQIIEYMERLSQLNTEGVKPLPYILQMENVFREDVVVSKEDRQTLLEGAPAVKNGCFLVPKTVE